MNKKRVVITGIGPIGSCGIGKDAFWKGILAKETNLREEKVVVDGEVWGKFWLHKVEGFDINKFGIDRDKLQDIKDWKEGEEVTDLNYLIAAIKLALDDSKLKFDAHDNGISLVLAHENLGLMPFGFKISNLAYEMLIGKNKKEFQKKDFLDKFYSKFLKSGYDVQSFANLFHVARVFNIHNYSLFLNNACASGLYSIEAAAQIIRSEQAKAVVVAASDQPEIYKYLWFKQLGIYADDGKIKPYCLDSNGLVFGEGGAGIVLEDYDFAKKRNAKIYAEYCGGGFDLEGWKITVPELGSRSYQTAINRSFAQSGMKKGDIDLLCPHGVGSQPIDYYEAKAITDTFGMRPRKPFITTFKPYVGHNLGGSALLESVAMLMSLDSGIIPQTPNMRNPDPKFNINPVDKNTSKEIKTAMKICCAFAGFNAAAIFKAER